MAAQNQIKYDKTKELGRGSYGTVYRGTFRGIEVAVKRIPQDQVEPREEEAMCRFDHPNIVKLLCIEEETNAYRYYYVTNPNKILRQTL